MGVWEWLWLGGGLVCVGRGGLEWLGRTRLSARRSSTQRRQLGIGFALIGIGNVCMMVSRTLLHTPDAVLMLVGVLLLIIGPGLTVWGQLE